MRETPSEGKGFSISFLSLCVPRLRWRGHAASSSSNRSDLQRKWLLLDRPSEQGEREKSEEKAERDDGRGSIEGRAPGRVVALCCPHGATELRIESPGPNPDWRIRSVVSNEVR